MNILVVDDSKTMRTILGRGIDKCVDGATIIEAGDGVEALKLFEANEIHAVLSNWNMPYMDGLALLKAVRERDEEIPFVMVSTEAERHRIITAIQAGVSDYLTKPFTPQALDTKLKRWVATS